MISAGKLVSRSQFPKLMPQITMSFFYDHKGPMTSSCKTFSCQKRRTIAEKDVLLSNRSHRSTRRTIAHQDVKLPNKTFPHRQIRCFFNQDITSSTKTSLCLGKRPIVQEDVQSPSGMGRSLCLNTNRFSFLSSAPPCTTRSRPCDTQTRCCSISCERY